jgi:hypothetical protein
LPGENTTVWLTYTASLTYTGSYSSFMNLETNAPSTPETAVPIQMTVLAPELAWSPPTPVNLPAGTSLTQSWTLTNAGQLPLTYTLALPPDLTWLEMAPLSGTISAEESTTVWLTYTAPLTFTGAYTGTLTLYTNDPNVPETAVPVQMTVTSAAAYYQYIPLLIRAD